jgi:hypothetical protein
MALITSSKLDITVDAAKKTATPVVTCTILFTSFEMSQMKQGLRFRLDCELWGEDLGRGNWLDADDFLYRYSSKFFPDPTPTASESVTFKATFPKSVLDEDIWTDEVYGDLLLRNLYTNVAVRKKTNVISYSF